MEITSKDPRDIELVVPRPFYRVHYWNADRTHSWEYELGGAADVHEVIAWADEHAEDREYDLVVVAERTAYVLINTGAF